ncbi:MAG: hypothetical protein KTR18_01225 [Acidiferrobacterales bacterium]|nr:hypothetical protein [Acidiferrobacterales bacterium]
MKSLSAILAVIIAVGYPLMVYFGLQQYGSRGLAIVLLAAVCIRYYLVRPATTIQSLGVIVVGIFSLCIIALDSELLLRFYPVVLSVSVAAFFFFSLWSEKTAIEKFAEISGEIITPTARYYMRRLTICWVALMLLNAAIAAYTALYMSLSHWTLYNGVLSYLLIGLFMLGEWLYRQHYKRTRGTAG